MMSRTGVQFGGFHRLLAAQSAVAVLTVASRLAPLGRRYALPHQALRWVDLGTMLVWPPASVAVSYELLRWTQRGARTPRPVALLFLAGTYLLAAGYGNHAVTNYLHGRLRDAAPEPNATKDGGTAPPRAGEADGPGTVLERVREIVAFHDERFSHPIFFAGSACIDVALVLAQAAHPRHGGYATWDRTLLCANAMVIAAGIWLNAAFTGAQTSMPAMTLVAAAGLGTWARAARRGETVPVATYVGLAYAAGTAGMALAAALRAAGRRPGAVDEDEDGGAASNGQDDARHGAGAGAGAAGNGRT